MLEKPSFAKRKFNDLVVTVVTAAGEISWIFIRKTLDGGVIG